MTATQKEIKDILKSRNLIVSVDSRVWVLSSCGTWREVTSAEQARTLDLQFVKQA